MRINNEGKALIRRFEGLRLDAYLCPAGKATIGYGHTGDVKLGQKITEHQADVILDFDLEKFEHGVTSLLGALKLNENQFAALVSFAFNLGINALAKSTLLKCVKASEHDKAGAEFMKWKYAAGKVLPGLVKRRAAERALYLAPV